MGELAERVETSVERETSIDDKRLRRCRRCDNPVTANRYAITVEGLHEHVQANPHGVVFLFGCFADAPGCDVVGDPTDEHTWFSGYRWQFALCDGCMTHLGWYFRSGGDGFFGLLLDRLTRE